MKFKHFNFVLCYMVVFILLCVFYTFTFTESCCKNATFNPSEHANTYINRTDIVFSTTMFGDPTIRSAASDMISQLCPVVEQLRYFHPDVPFIAFHNGSFSQAAQTYGRDLCGVNFILIPESVTKEIEEAVDERIKVYGNEDVLWNGNFYRLALLQFNGNFSAQAQGTTRIEAESYKIENEIKQIIHFDLDIVFIGSMKPLVDCTAKVCGMPLLPFIADGTVVGYFLGFMRFWYSLFGFGMPTLLVAGVNGGIYSFRPHPQVYRNAINQLKHHKNSLAVAEQDYFSSIFYRDPFFKLYDGVDDEDLIKRKHFELMSASLNMCQSYKPAANGWIPTYVPEGLPGPPNCDVRAYHFQGNECKGYPDKACMEFKVNSCKFEAARDFSLNHFYTVIEKVYPICGKLRTKAACQSNDQCQFQMSKIDRCRDQTPMELETKI